MDLDAIRSAISSGAKRLRITTHAQVEAFKHGLTLADLRQTLETGGIIEEYPDEHRALVLGETIGEAWAVHVVMEDNASEVVIVTAYLPDEAQWIAGRRRRRHP